MSQIIKFKHDSATKLLTAEGEFSTFKDFLEKVADMGLATEGMVIYEHTTAKYYKPNDAIPSSDDTLTVYLTADGKKIRSGAYTRHEVYAKINEYGLRTAIREKYGRSYTSISTPTLLEEVETYESSMISPDTAEAVCDSSLVTKADLQRVQDTILEKLEEILHETTFNRVQNSSNF